MKYTITISADAGAALAPIGDLLERVNTIVANDGYDERLKVRFKPCTMTLTTERELTNSERETVKKELLAQFSRTLPAWQVRIESFRRQSCQSTSKSR